VQDINRGAPTESASDSYHDLVISSAVDFLHATPPPLTGAKFSGDRKQ